MIYLLIALGLVAFYYNFIRPYNYWKNKGVKQGKPWLFFGDYWPVLFRVMDMAEFTAHTYKKLSNVRYYGIYQFFKQRLVICDPELIKAVIVKDFDHFTDHAVMIDPEADPLFGKNLISLKGEEWRKMRLTLTGSFTSSKIKVMFNLISEAAEKFVNYFESQEGNTEVEMKDAFTRYTINVIATTSFGVKVDSLSEKNNQFFLMGKQITEISFASFIKVLIMQVSLKLYRLLKLRMFTKDVNEFFIELVRNTIKTREEKNIYRSDMLQILMEARKGIDNDELDTVDAGFAANSDFIERSKIPRNYSIEDITAQAVIFFFAGFDSVSSAMTFATYELAVNQDIQDKLRAEIYQTLVKCEGKLTYEALVEMKYMDMVISEVLRKWPPFPVIGRQCTKTYVIEPSESKEKRLVVPEGMSVQIPLYAIHHDPKYFSDPEIFDPERFNPENKNKLTPYTYMSFGQGPRSCIGSRFALVEIKTIIFYILSRFKLVVTDKTQIPLKLTRKFSVNIRPEQGLWLGLQRL